LRISDKKGNLDFNVSKISFIVCTINTVSNELCKLYRGIY
jgi:hypothetical protein